MTINKYWNYLECLRQSGTINMYAAIPYLEEQFSLNREDARKILKDWMKNYNENDYKN